MNVDFMRLFFYLLFIFYFNLLSRYKLYNLSIVTFDPTGFSPSKSHSVSSVNRSQKWNRNPKPME